MIAKTSFTFSRTIRFTSLLAVFACAAAALPVSAQSEGNGNVPASEASHWAIGLGAASRQLPYAGVDRKNNVLPLVYFSNRWLRVVGGTAELKLLDKAFTPTQTLTAGLVLKYEDQGYQAGDSLQLTGMQDRKDGFWGGAVATWRNPVAQLSAEWVADLSENSQGQKLQLRADRRFVVGHFSVTPRVQAQWLDEKYVDYYFGVRAGEASPGRAVYAGQSAMTVEVGLRMDYALNRQHAVFLDLSTTRLPDEIAFSPIVDRSNTSRVAVGYLYRF